VIIEVEQELDGRWIADVPELPGVIVYGKTRVGAVRNVKVLALRVLSDIIEHGESGAVVDILFTETSK
jgi:predicted RNase H-like HicB family nuclease